MKTEGVGDKFQRETKYSRYKMTADQDWSIQPELYKSHPNSKRIPLPSPASLTESFLDEVLKKRRSIRNYPNSPITKDQLSYLLWASTGIQRREMDFEYRTAPSAGALYPIETYIVVNNVKDIDKGVYHYNIKDHLLEEIKLGDHSQITAKAALGQDMCAEGAVVFIWTAFFNRSKCKYGQRAYRYIYLDAGHIAGNLALASTSLGLGSCQIAALFDDEVNKIIDVDGKDESTIYMSVVGNLD
jgi:SagB-type dehydrogenase family enzyme